MLRRLAAALGLLLCFYQAAPAQEVSLGPGRFHKARALIELMGSGHGRPVMTLDFTAGVLPSNVVLSRLSQATYFNSAGLLVTASANQPRFNFDQVTHVAYGLWTEEARQNAALWARDLTQAVWTATGATVALDQTGIDGAANSASSITATAPAATVLQTVTIASSVRAQTAFVKRITGVGAVSMTLDNVTFTPIALTAAYTRFFIPIQTLANPVIGFKLATSGDKIAVDYVDNENGVIPTMPILTTSSVASRSADVATMATSTFRYNPLASTLVAKVYRPYGVNDATTSPQILEMDDGTSSNMVDVHFRDAASNFSRVITVANVSIIQVDAGTETGPGTIQTAGFAWKVGFDALVANGTTVGSDAPAAIPVVTQARIGSRVSNIQFLNGGTLKWRYFNAALTAAQMNALPP